MERVTAGVLAAVMALGILFVSTLSRGITYFRKTKSTGR